MNPFEGRIRAKIEKLEATKGTENVVDVLIEEFPAELHDRLNREVELMNDKTAEDFLITKLVERKRALVSMEMHNIPEDVFVTHECPVAILRSLEREVPKDHEDYLGSGENGKVLASVRQERACYKVLYPERVRDLGLNIVREAVMQHNIQKLLSKHKDVARVPQVLAFVDHERARAVMMEKIDGCSLLDIFKGKNNFPQNFDIEVFFAKLEKAVTVMNEQGYYHKDLTNNAGNVMIDAEGNPWIVDFGSAIKSCGVSSDPRFYQITNGGAYIFAHDVSGIQSLKKRVLEHQKKEGVA